MQISEIKSGLPLKAVLGYYELKPNKYIIYQILDTTETPAMACGIERNLVISDLAFFAESIQ